MSKKHQDKQAAVIQELRPHRDPQQLVRESMNIGSSMVDNVFNAFEAPLNTAVCFAMLYMAAAWVVNQV